MIEANIIFLHSSPKHSHSCHSHDKQSKRTGDHAGAGSATELNVIGDLGEISSHFRIPDIVHVGQVNPEIDMFRLKLHLCKFDY